jgi:hypothetical protein
MSKYLITWQMELEAETPQKAALVALEIQRDPASTATVFDVYDFSKGTSTRVDADEIIN